MLLRAFHPDLTGLETAQLSAAASAAGTALTVYSNQGFAAADYIVIGKLGQDKTELRKISSVSGNTTINLVGDALLYDHGKDTLITKIPFNQVKFYKATASGGSFSAVQTSSIDVDQADTVYDYTSGLTTDFFKFSYYNSTTAVESTLSDEFAGTGPDQWNAGAAIDLFMDSTGFKQFTREQLLKFVNAGLMKAVEFKEKWSDLFVERTFSSATSQTKTFDSIATAIRKVTYVIYKQNFPELVYVDEERFWQLVANGATTSSTGQPTHYTIIGRTIYFYPTTATASDTVYVGTQKYPDQITSEATSIPKSLSNTVIPYLLYMKAVREGKSATSIREARDSFEIACQEAAAVDGSTDEPKMFMATRTAMGW